MPVIGMVGGIAAMALANHERLKQRIEALEKRLAEAAAGSIAPDEFQFWKSLVCSPARVMVRGVVKGL